MMRGERGRHGAGVQMVPVRKITCFNCKRRGYEIVQNMPDKEIRAHNIRTTDGPAKICDYCWKTTLRGRT